jgi:hypothetical protein
LKYSVFRILLPPIRSAPLDVKIDEVCGVLPTSSPLTYRFAIELSLS